MRRRLGLQDRYEWTRWVGADSQAHAIGSLTQWAQQALQQPAVPSGAWVLSLGVGDDYQLGFNQALQRQGLAYRSASLEQLAGWGQAECAGVVLVLCAGANAGWLTAAARTLARHAWLSNTPTEYCGGLDPERAQFARQDEYRDTYFVSPVLLDQPGPYAIYQESLQLFEQKCGLRDYLDLYQLLRQVCANAVPGEIAEFGSYRGHSGWLIARTLQALDPRRRLYMFDMFESFPAEGLGVDHFWNSSHDVKFEEVRDKLAPFEQVTLVRGDFTKTLTESGLTRLALAYVDCDSYRATRYLLDTLLDPASSVQLSSGGILVCEDYGHPALLGNRAAVHESLDGVRGGFRFFSQFSGYYIFVKY